MILSVVRNWIDAEVEHKLYLSNIIKKFTLTIESAYGPQRAARMECYYFVKDVERLILSHELKDILLSIDVFKEYKRKAGVVSDMFVKEVERVFNYKSFTVKGPKWNAYALCRKSKARICPYCNHAYAFTVQSDSGDFRPTLDHFFFKDEYPHLALTLYNLVPSCSSCNSSLKGEVDFFKEGHLNPLFDVENIEFYLSAGGAPSELVEAIQNRRIDVLVKAKAVKECSQSENSLKTFAINERYETLSMEAVDFYLAKKNYDEAALNTQFSFKFDETALLRFDRANYSRYLLGKMYADIYDALSR